MLGVASAVGDVLCFMRGESFLDHRMLFQEVSSFFFPLATLFPLHSYLLESMITGMPRGRFSSFPGLGIYTLRTGGGLLCFHCFG